MKIEVEFRDSGLSFNLTLEESSREFETNFGSFTVVSNGGSDGGSDGSYDEGYEKGYAEGNADGYAKGREDAEIFLTRDSNVIFDDHAENIGEYTFYYWNVEDVDMRKVRSVGTNAFYNCTSLKRINLPAVETLGDSAFRGCTGLTEVSFPMLKTAIYRYTFMGCSNLHTISAPLLTEAVQQFVNSCVALKNVYLPACESLGTYAFRNCEGLEYIKLESCKTIANYAFQYCYALKTVDLPTVTEIQTAVFSDCTALEALIIRTDSVCTLKQASSLTTSGIGKGTGFIYVPDNLVDSYKTATNWKTFATQIKPLSELAE